MIQGRSNCAWPLPARQHDEEVAQATGLVSRENEESRAAAGAGLSPFALLSVLYHSPFASDSVAEVCHCMGAPFLSLAVLKEWRSLETTTPECLSSSLKSVLTLVPPGSS